MSTTYDPSHLGQAVLATTMTDFYTATIPTIVKEILLCNLTTNIVNTEIALLLSGETLANKNYIFKGNNITLQAYESKMITLSTYMPTNSKIQMASNGSNSVSCTVSGVKLTIV